jgi:hypothetical protein
MLAEGNVVFFGSPRDSLSYLRQTKLTCPDGYNAADHWMDLLVQDSTIDESTMVLASKKLSSTDKVCTPEQLNRMTTRDQLILAWDDEAVADQMDLATNNTDKDNPTALVPGSCSPLIAGAATTTTTNKYNTSWAYQYRTLVHRSLKNSRSAIFTPINLIKSAALGFVSGALWFQIEYTEANVFDINSFFFFAMS